MPLLSADSVYKLKRSLYGLKQAPRAWFDKFCCTLLDFSFTQSQYDASLFLHKGTTGIVFLLRLQQHLHSVFHMEDLGHLTYFVGLEVHTTQHGIFLNQHKYIQDLIRLGDLCDSSSVDTPLEINVKYRKDEGDVLPNPTLYRKLVGSLIYLTITRPNISFAVHTVSKFMDTPCHLHFVAIRRIIHYLIGTSHRGLFFPRGMPFELKAYSDADWAGYPDSRRSTTGWCIFLGSALIYWKCKKQNCVSKSSTEAEYRAMSATCSEVVWLRGLVTELAVSKHSLHLSIIADIFTKSMTHLCHNFLISKLMLVDSPASI
ncbi:uncharacterized protein LOC111391836 [Olea europaea var. sylvestris]|uniref:uncharacterized protein LOC111391836 n=1 Tax=Olea europaea var. sylvestris TaxID=158386 RepID=UPI000C1D85FC|nr:uncharacterized protein LOC111391836 [Olea europaea var. sylvestris]